MGAVLWRDATDPFSWSHERGVVQQQLQTIDNRIVAASVRMNGTEERLEELRGTLHAFELKVIASLARIEKQ